MQSKTQATGQTGGRAPRVWRRWPDREVLALFRRLACELRDRSQSGDAHLAGIPLHGPFADVCEGLWSSNDKSSRISEHSLADPTPFDRLHRVASALGMLMHFSAGPQLVNLRRPGKSFTTYPDHPLASKLLAKHILNRLLKEHVPEKCSRVVDAERFAAQALDFRVADPSMEAGQVLLEIAISMVEQILDTHDWGTRGCHYLIRAVIEHLCNYTLWGIDRNPRAIVAVRTVFKLLARVVGTPPITPRNLHCTDAMDYLSREDCPRFNGIANNPPWGESLTADDRERLCGLTTGTHRRDTYLGFAELGIGRLCPNGVYALILPSQFIGARNAGLLRRLLAQDTVIEQLTLLPRAAFADAAVRGMVVLGRKRQCASASSYVRVTVYPLVKDLRHRGPPCEFSVPTARLHRLGNASWAGTLMQGPEFRVPTIPLSSLGTALSGVKMYRVGRGQPPQSEKIVSSRPFTYAHPVPGAVPGVRGRDIRDFRMARSSVFIALGPWLAETGQHEALMHTGRVFVRELCRRDGKLNAAIAPPGCIPLHGVITVVPQGVDPYILVAILNSGVAASFVRSRAASFSKVDFQRVTVSELLDLPVPTAAVVAPHPHRLNHSEPRTDSARLLATSVQRFLVTGQDSPEAAELRAYIEKTVAELYGSQEA